MSESAPPESMFERNIDFKMETTTNSYSACRALSIRARDVNTKNMQLERESGLSSPLNPTAVALSDYSVGRIALTDTGVEDPDDQT